MEDFIFDIPLKNSKNINIYNSIIIPTLNKLIINKKTIKKLLKQLNKDISLYKVCTSKFITNFYFFIKDFILNIYPFIKMFIIYLINKYYHKLSELDFVMLVYRDKETFEFFRQLNKIKSIFCKGRYVHTTVAKIAIYYLILLAFFSIYFPWTWFLLRVLTDPQNWMMHFFEDVRLGIAL